MVPHSSILAWRIPWTEGPDKLYVEVQSWTQLKQVNVNGVYDGFESVSKGRAWRFWFLFIYLFCLLLAAWVFIGELVLCLIVVWRGCSSLSSLILEPNLQVTRPQQLWQWSVSLQHTGFSSCSVRPGLLVNSLQASFPCGMWDLSGPELDVPCIGRQIPNNWTTRLFCCLMVCCLNVFFCVYRHTLESFLKIFFFMFMQQQLGLSQFNVFLQLYPV